MKLVVVKIIIEVLLVPNKRVFRVQMNYVNVKASRHLSPFRFIIIITKALTTVSPAAIKNVQPLPSADKSGSAIAVPAAANMLRARLFSATSEALL